MMLRRFVACVLGAIATLGVLALGPVVESRDLIQRRTTPARSTSTIPARLTDQEFWRLITEFSEPNGYFRSENLVSNEHTFQYVVPALKRAVRPGSVYLGVAPDQNFTYMIAIEPKIAFIVDIRRGNLLELMMYKAIIEQSADRVDFLSRLFSKRRPPGVGPRSTVIELFAAFDKVETSEALYRQNVRSIEEWLTRRHTFGLSAEDLQDIEGIYFQFFWEGPSLRYTSTPGAFIGPRGGFMGGRGFGGTSFPSYEELMMQVDWDGRSRSYLASEENFKILRDMQERNVIVPIVGNFAGTKALRAVGRYIRDHGATVGAFYVSNVEQYLFQDGLWPEFAKNVATLPIDDSSVFIRSVSSRYGYTGPYLWSDGRASALDPMRAFVRDFRAGKIQSYTDVNARSK